MASTTTKAAAMKSILTPSVTFEGHGESIRSISYFPDGERMISGSEDKTVRQWDLKAGKEIERARSVCEGDVWAVAVSGDDRWVVTAGGDWNSVELKVCEVETGIVKIFEGHSSQITCVDISADNTLLATGAKDFTVRIWNLDTGKLVAGPFESVAWVSAVRFSQDSKKLAVRLDRGTGLEVWNVQKQKLDVRIGKLIGVGVLPVPVFWTNKNKNILTAFTFTVDVAWTIYEFDASTLETVGASFEGHTGTIESLALSFDCTLLASASADDNTIKLWAFESRQLLASFDVHNIRNLTFSLNSRQLAYVTYNRDDYKIYICNTPLDVLAQAGISAHKKSTLNDFLHSDATRRPPAGRLRQPISIIPRPQRPPLTIDSQQPVFARIRKLLHFSPRTNVTPPAQPRNPLDVPATLPLPSSLPGRTATHFDHFEMSSLPRPSNGVTQFLRQRLSFLVPRHSLVPPVVEVAPGRKVTRLAAAKLPEYKKVDDTRHPSSQQATMPQENDSADIDSLPDVHWCKAFLCYYSCWSHGRLRMPPRWRLERVDIPRQGDTANSSHTGAHGRS